MKNKSIITGLFFAVVLNSCTTIKYLPQAEEIDINQYGSYINISQNKGVDISGELLAIDSSQLIVLTESKMDYSKKSIIVPVTDINSFTLKYANSKHYGWTIPLFTLATISHGFYFILTAPVNLIVTISVTASGEGAFKYNSKKITYDELKMFARFPQGIPGNINIASIK